MIELLLELLLELGQSFRPYQYQSAIAIVATLLVIFGRDINYAVKKIIIKQHFVIRITVFVLVCAFGYGLATLWLSTLLNEQLAKIPDIYIVPTIIIFFIFLGAYAEKQRHI